MVIIVPALRVRSGEEKKKKPPSRVTLYYIVLYLFVFNKHRLLPPSIFFFFSAQHEITRARARDKNFNQPYGYCALDVYRADRSVGKS